MPSHPPPAPASPLSADAPASPRPFGEILLAALAHAVGRSRWHILAAAIAVTVLTFVTAWLPLDLPLAVGLLGGAGTAALWALVWALRLGIYKEAMRLALEGGTLHPAHAAGLKSCRSALRLAPGEANLIEKETRLRAQRREKGA